MIHPCLGVHFGVLGCSFVHLDCKDQELSLEVGASLQDRLVLGKAGKTVLMCSVLITVPRSLTD